MKQDQARAYLMATLARWRREAEERERAHAEMWRRLLRMNFKR